MSLWPEENRTRERENDQYVTDTDEVVLTSAASTHPERSTHQSPLPEKHPSFSKLSAIESSSVWCASRRRYAEAQFRPKTRYETVYSLQSNNSLYFILNLQVFSHLLTLHFGFNCNERCFDNDNCHYHWLNHCCSFSLPLSLRPKLCNWADQLTYLKACGLLAEVTFLTFYNIS